MSSERSSSAVRSLRSIFENKASESSSDLRGRSPGGLSDIDFQRPHSKVRASFVPVELSKAAAARAEMEGASSEAHRENSMDNRRGSFSGGKSGNALEGSSKSSGAGQGEEVAIESAAATPLVEINKQLGSKVDKPAANPDKPVTGAEEEPASMKPADPASEAAVSGGKGVSGAAEDLRRGGASKKPTTSKPSTNGRPSMLVKDASKSAASASKSMANQPKSPLSPLKAPLKKQSRSSLTAPTAASAARASTAEKSSSGTSGKVASPPPRVKAREATKPIEVSSHLTAPTAASRARHEPTPAAPKPTTAPRPKPSSTSTRPNVRASLVGRPESGASQNSKGKAAGSAEGGFLDRMTRPTAASSNKSQEKPEVKSPPRKQQLPIVPKPATQAKPAKTTAAAPKLAKAEPQPSVPSQPGKTAEEVPSSKAASSVTESADPAPESSPATVPAPTSQPPIESKSNPVVAAELAKEPVVGKDPVPAAEPEPEPVAASVVEPVVAPAAASESAPAAPKPDEEATTAPVQSPEPAKEAEVSESTGEAAEAPDAASEATPAVVSEE